MKPSHLSHVERGILEEFKREFLYIRCREEEEEWEEAGAFLVVVRRKVEVDCSVEERQHLRKDRSDPRPGDRFRRVRRRPRILRPHPHVHRRLLRQHAEREVVS